MTDIELKIIAEVLGVSYQELLDLGIKIYITGKECQVHSDVQNVLDKVFYGTYNKIKNVCCKLCI